MPKLIYHDSDQVDKSMNLGSEPILIGRATECAIQTQDAMVSRRHAKISWDGGYWIEDLGSSNGVYVGHEKVSRAPFRPGDVVTCGSLVIRMIPDTARPSTTSMQPQNLHSQGTGPRDVWNPPSQPAFQASPPSQPAFQPPPQQQYQAPPQRTQALPQPSPAEVRSGRTPPTGEPNFDAMAERKRREEAERAVLTANDRAQAAEREVAQLRQRVAELEAGGGGGGGSNEETEMLRRKVEQMTADMRRMRQGAGDAAKMAELTDQLRRVESERDQLRQRGGGGGGSPEAADAAIALGDALAELRSSLRAASDEATVLTAPEQSVTVVAEALGQATEQLERARAALRTLGKLLGVA